MNQPPRRLHPASMFMDVLRNLPQTLIALPAVAGFVGRFGWSRVVLIALAGFAVNAVIAWVRWRRFTYAIADEAVVIESGVFSRNRRIIPLDRVQDVDIERKLLQRLFGLAKISLETGGAGKDEATLDSVSLTEAERLRGVIRGRSTTAPAVDGAVDSAAGADTSDRPAATVLFAMGLPRLVLFGLFSFSLVWMAVLFGALQYLDDVLPWKPADARDWFRAARSSGYDQYLNAWLVLSVVATFAVLGFVAGIASTVLRDAGFRLTDEGGRLRRVRGLLTRTEAVVALRRVQLALLTTGPIRNAFGWSGLALQTLGGSGDATGRQDVAPFAQAREIDAVLATTPMRRVAMADLQRVSSAHVVRALARLAIPLGIALGVSSAFGMAWLVLPIAPLLLMRALLTRRYHRFGRGGGQLSIHRGVIRRRLWLIPERNIQVVTIRRSLLQRWLGSASVLPDTAGGRGARARISDIAAPEAWRLAEALAAARLSGISARPGAAAPSASRTEAGSGTMASPA